MRILIDCLVVKPRQAGLRSYALGLVESMANLPGTDIVVLTPTNMTSDWAKGLRVSTARLRKNSALERAMWRRLHLQRRVRCLNADIVITVSPEWADAGVPTIVVVHDLGPALAPGLYGWTRALRYALTLGRTVRKATGIVAVSEGTRFDLLRWVGPELSAKVRVVRNAGQELPPPPREVPDSLLPPGTYALYVGAYLKHKNVKTILDLYSRRSPGLPEYLVCVGPEYEGEKARTLAPYTSADWLISPGFVDSSALSALYANATVVLYPSLFEGFGLPLLEALEHGCSVIATRLPVFEEVAGEAPEYVDSPLSIDAWEAAMRRAVTSSEPQNHQRPKLSKRRWSDVAKEMIDFVHHVVVESSGTKDRV